MICENIQKVIGFEVHPVDGVDNMLWIDTPFTFADGGGLSLYAEHIGSTVKFFDAGETLLYFMGRGVNVEGSRGVTFIKKIVANHGVELSPSGDIQIISSSEMFGDAFASYIAAMLEIITWEKEQENIDTDLDMFIQEVAMYFMSAYPNEEHKASPEFTGITGHKYYFDFIHGNRAVLAINPHPNSVSAALKKVIDLNQTDQLDSLVPFFIIDDRKNAEAADSEAKVLSVAADVMKFSALAIKAKASTSFVS